MLFTLITHVNGQFTTVTAERQGRTIAITTPDGVAPARSFNDATRAAAKIIGPLLDRAQRTGSAWGLYVSAGTASAIFGQFPPDPQSPTIVGRQDRRSTPLTRLYDHWKSRDGSPLGALDTAIKIIDQYAERGQRVVA